MSETTTIEVPAKPIPPDLAPLYRAEIGRLAEAQEPTSGSLSLELTGDIPAMIGLALNTNSGRKLMFSAADRALLACSVNVVAGTGCHLYRTTLRSIRTIGADDFAKVGEVSSKSPRTLPRFKS